MKLKEFVKMIKEFKKENGYLKDMELEFFVEANGITFYTKEVNIIVTDEKIIIGGKE